MADSVSFDTVKGEFKITSEMYSQTYNIGNEKIGRTEYLTVNAKRLKSDAGRTLVAITGSVGGSGCSEVVSIATIVEEGVYFSPALNACGGVNEIYIDNGVVIIQALERDEITPITYKVKGDWASENNGPLTSGYKFIE
ncbi:hypothetical protein Maes01_02813 [Microbulbifer aestuariivivens]|uniref:Uncharacterized protein n=2 Tax=Microbulbifer aestuariivivens TaxID=1908308 RepID=A0ABP9WSV0_9GAMM